MPVEPGDDTQRRFAMVAGDLSTHSIGTPIGWDSFVERIVSLLAGPDAAATRDALNLAFAGARKYVADPAHGAVPVAGLLAPEYAAERRQLIGEGPAIATPGAPRQGGTVYSCAADGDGLMVSYIQSNDMGFGSGIVPPGTGVARFSSTKSSPR